MVEKHETFFRIHHLPPYHLGDVAKAVIDARVAGRDIIDLSQFNPSLSPPATAVDKLVQASLQPHNHRYSASQGITKLREAIARWYERRDGLTLDVEREIVVTMGTKEALSHLLFAVLSQGDTVLLPTPSYPIHNAGIVLAGGNVIGVPLYESTDEAAPTMLTEADDGFFHRLKVAYEGTWPRPIMMLLSFPHNPTTIVVTEGFLKRLVEFALAHGIYLIHDFAYADLCFDGYRAPSLLSIPGAKEIALECYSVSKGLSMPGWRVGFCVGNERLIGALKKIKSYLDCGIFQPLQIATVRVLDGHERLVADHVETYRARRNVLADGLKSLGFELERPKGTVFVWAKIPRRYRDQGSLSFVKEVLERTQVAVCPGVGFDSHTDQFVRFALAEGEARLRSALNQLKPMFDTPDTLPTSGSEGEAARLEAAG